MLCIPRVTQTNIITHIKGKRCGQPQNSIPELYRSKLLSCHELNQTVTDLKTVFKILFCLPFKTDRRYSQLRRLTSSSCRGLWPLSKAFFAPRHFFFFFFAVFAYFRPFLVFSSNLSNF